MKTADENVEHGDSFGLAELLLDSIPVGVIFCDINCVVRFINKTYAGYIGIDRRDALGKKINDLIPSSRAAVVMQSAVPELRGTCRLKRDDGYTNLIVNRIPVKNIAGKVVGFVSQSIIADTDELKELAEKISQLNKEVAFYKRRVQSALSAIYSLDQILGQSFCISKVKEHLALYAITEAPLLIVGETGTGKELFASALHLESPRYDGPFVCINCAAIPHELFESELFGYSAGAFSGARKEGKVGQIELADSGTLFLDEIADMPMHIQAKLLRVIEDKNVLRIGSSTPGRVDFRLVTATNRDLKTAIRQGKFREDLYYRISSLILTIPPLRDREGDILLLIRHFLEKLERTDIVFSECAREAMVHYSWPGNVRELRNVITRSVSLCRGKVIEAGDLPPEIAACRGECTEDDADRAPALLMHMCNSNERSVIISALDKNNWNMVRTAQYLGISRAGLYKKLNQLDIRRLPAAKKASVWNF